MIVGKSRVRKGTRIYAIGDVHGCLKELKTLLQMIERDLRKNPADSHKLVFLGDYIDRGPENKAVITALLRLKRSKRKTVFLRGNHDQKFIDFLSTPDQAGEGFLRWGGGATIRDYGVRIGKKDTYKNIAARLKKKIPKSHLQFLSSAKLFHVEDDYFFAHAGVKPGVSLEKQKPEDLIWIRTPFIENTKPYPKVIVHGHTPSAKPEIKSNRINVDTRCYGTGKLSAVVLEGNTQRFLVTPSK